MTIIEIIQKLPLQQYKPEHLFRCIGRNPEPKILGDRFGLNETEAQRMHAAVAAANTQSTDHREGIREFLASTEGWTETRYSPGNFRVLYTAIDFETAVTERSFWAFEDLVHTHKHQDYKINLEILEICYDGTYYDITHLTKDWPTLVHPKNYSLCQEVGKFAKECQSSDSLAVNSARRFSGVNHPLFCDDNLGQISGRYYLSVQNYGSHCECTVDGSAFKFCFDNVYDSIIDHNDEEA